MMCKSNSKGMSNKKFLTLYSKIMLPKLKWAAQSYQPTLMEYRLRDAIYIIEELVKELEQTPDE